MNAYSSSDLTWIPGDGPIYLGKSHNSVCGLTCAYLGGHTRTWRFPGIIHTYACPRMTCPLACWTLSGAENCRWFRILLYSRRYYRRADLHLGRWISVHTLQESHQNWYITASCSSRKSCAIVTQWSSWYHSRPCSGIGLHFRAHQGCCFFARTILSWLCNLD